MTSAAMTLRQRRLLEAVRWLSERPHAAMDLGTLRALDTIVLSAHHPYSGHLRNADGFIRLDGIVTGRLCPPAVGIRRMRAALAWLNHRVGDDAYPAFETARELMFRIAKAHPFVDGNGRIARALVTWLLLTNGYVLCGDPEAYCRQNRPSYHHALACHQEHDDVSRPSGAWEAFFSGMVDACFRSRESLTNCI